VCSRNLRNEVAIACVGQQRHREKRISERKISSEERAFFTPIEFKLTEVKRV
jgi:hypothetical protein